MFLIDTNCWMQLARQRPHFAEVRQMLKEIPPNQLLVTDFTVHGIGVLFRRFDMIEGFTDFLKRASIGNLIAIVQVPLPNLEQVQQVCVEHGVDFDDAYQYVAAELFGARIVSFDDDYDRTPIGRLTPAQALQRFTDEQTDQSKDA